LYEGKIYNSSDPRFIDGVTNVPNKGPGTVGYSPATDIVLRWSSFSELAEGAGISRRYGGIHFKQGDLEGRKLGRAVGAAVWEKFLPYIPNHEPSSLNCNQGTNQSCDNTTRTNSNNRLRRLLQLKRH